MTLFTHRNLLELRDSEDPIKLIQTYQDIQKHTETHRDLKKTRETQRDPKYSHTFIKVQRDPYKLTATYVPRLTDFHTDFTESN